VEQSALLISSGVGSDFCRTKSRNRSSCFFNGNQPQPSLSKEAAELYLRFIENPFDSKKVSRVGRCANAHTTMRAWHRGQRERRSAASSAEDIGQWNADEATSGVIVSRGFEKYDLVGASAAHPKCCCASCIADALLSGDS
jgi:hypothetical protein